jgi:hypothetical protein
MGGCLPDFAGWSGYASTAVLSVNARIGAMCQVWKASQIRPVRLVEPVRAATWRLSAGMAQSIFSDCGTVLSGREDRMLKIFGAPHSRAFRVIWLANEIGIPYEHIPVTFSVERAMQRTLVSRAEPERTCARY